MDHEQRLIPAEGAGSAKAPRWMELACHALGGARKPMRLSEAGGTKGMEIREQQRQAVILHVRLSFRLEATGRSGAEK